MCGAGACDGKKGGHHARFMAMHHTAATCVVYISCQHFLSVLIHAFLTHVICLCARAGMSVNYG
jgi:hypothetical protein